jgi:hypothetical protein
MTQFSTPRQVFENFFDHQDLLKNLSAACICSLSKAALCAAKPSIMTQFFSLQPAF